MQISKLIDHTILKPDATELEVKKICDEAKEYSFKSVCVNSTYVKYVSEQLKGSDVLTCSVVGFPLGAMPTEVKSYETDMAIKNGADEIDMVINIGELKDKKYDHVLKDIKSVVEAAKGKTVKVIIETCLLEDEEKVKACELSVEASAHYVKTSTGFSTGGATEDDVKLMRKVVGDKLGVKASGGVRSLKDAQKMIKAGASRIGASSGVSIVLEEQSKN
ncbi:deoxyribose-phosphate aldolase [Tissierella creatinophila]|uniref:Deoxyribose-phosphate aldolase n=1 Tax=Tissierella creatinophila DSM 6911 TaxID=1123403 RepID=A0A1U7M622_TISCR|nr:deoxyribose-phosphate aldolase [Tissierella creatinophila]OLS02638.1 deoxyribose-phosphate aldolase 2 [Tissierella creatinophila DSM 6911]